MKQYMGHADPESGRTQALKEHLTETAKLASEFAEAFGAKELAYRCGVLHDLGKYSEAFQDRLLRNGPKTDHSTAGALEAFREGDVFSAFCVAGHHTGLPDGGNLQSDQPYDATLAGRMKRKAGEGIPDYSEYKTEIEIPRASPPVWTNKAHFRQAFFTRMLYSALTDADFLNTEEFMSGGRVERGAYEPVERLLERLEEYIARFWNAETELNGRRCEILRACLEAGKWDRGLFTLTVPTGGGKTIASLAFALRHAVKNGMKRVIYVIPYMNIIEQTARVFSDAVGKENVLEHHSQAEYGWNKEEGDPISDKKRLSTENWDAPVVVTTSVQFFESLFSNKSSRCRKLHNIAGSVIVFDEAQMLPLSFLKPCVAAVSELTANYGCTAVLCTATQPALDRLFRDYNPSSSFREICPEEVARHVIFKRVRFQDEGALSDTALAARLNGEPQALCIVNNRQEAQAVFALLKGEGSYHLSTLMRPFDRRLQLDEIKERLKDGLPCRVIATSLVEAGVDLDFPTVYRARAGLDSILQAAGRCNREGKRAAEESTVYIFDAEGTMPELFKKNAAAALSVMRRNGAIDAPETVKAYFTLLYMIRDEKEFDSKGIMEAFEKGIKGRGMPFETVAEEFKLIKENTRTVYIPVGEGAASVGRLQNGERSRALFREAGAFAVGLYPTQFKLLVETGAVRVYDESVSVLTELSLYDPRTGLTVRDSGGKEIFV